MPRARVTGNKLNPALTYLEQSERFSETEFTAHLSDLKFDKLGNLELTFVAPWSIKDVLLPNVSYAQGMPLSVTLKPYDGGMDDTVITRD